MATAILVGLTLLATGVDKSGFFTGPGGTSASKAAAVIFVFAMVMAIMYDLRQMVYM